MREDLVKLKAELLFNDIIDSPEVRWSLKTERCISFGHMLIIKVGRR